MTHLLTPPPLDASSELATLDQAARLTIRLASNLNIAALRFSERQRLARILRRIRTITGNIEDILPQIASAAPDFTKEYSDCSCNVDHS